MSIATNLFDFFSLGTVAEWKHYDEESTEFKEGYLRLKVTHSKVHFSPDYACHVDSYIRSAVVSLSHDRSALQWCMVSILYTWI